MTARRRCRARGGRSGKEPSSHIRLREVQVVEQMLEGRTQHQIASALGISQPAVSKILKRVEERLLAELADKVERHRARHTIRLEFVYGEAIRAWRASQQETLRRRQRKSEDAGGGAATVAEITSENRHGDPRYLEEARKALADLRKIWGVDAPARMTIDARPFASLSDAALDAELARQSRLLHVTAIEGVLDVAAPPADDDEEADHD